MMTARTTGGFSVVRWYPIHHIRTTVIEALSACRIDATNALLSKRIHNSALASLIWGSLPNGTTGAVVSQ